MSRLVGIVNVTPDSFSDGGKYSLPDAAIAHAKKLLQEGAYIVDIGAESTRPGAKAISPAEEWERLYPVLEGLKGLPVSVDTRNPKTAANALAAGASWVNDVSGFHDTDMIAAVRESNCTLVVMHSLTVPADKNITMPEEIDPVQSLIDWACARIGILENSGIKRERIIFDIGLGFGKTPEQSRYILENIEKFKTLNIPLLVGHSRKSFLGDVADKDAATLAISKDLSAKGVDYLRVHDIKAHYGSC